MSLQSQFGLQQPPTADHKRRTQTNSKADFKARMAIGLAGEQGLCANGSVRPTVGAKDAIREPSEKAHDAQEKPPKPDGAIKSNPTRCSGIDRLSTKNVRLAIWQLCRALNKRRVLGPFQAAC